MKVGIFTVLFADRPFEQVLDMVAAEGCEAVEIGCGGYPGNAHCKPKELLKSEAKQKAFLKAVKDRGLVISALSVHGNPLHPQTKIAKAFHDDWRDTVQLAAALKVERVVTFSGCPGDSDRAKYPNWVTCAWPPDYPEILQWQWEEKLIPYWKQEAAFAKKLGIRKICFEMHPGFAVHNPEALMRLREAVGESIGANFDPSHLWWQGMDPAAAIRYLGKAIYHFHAKDCRIVNDAPQWLALGEGSVDWPGQFDALARDGYRGWISLETHWPGPGGDKLQGSTICAHNLRRLTAGYASPS